MTAGPRLVQLKDLRGLAGHDVEGLEVEPGGREHHAARLPAQRRDARAQRLQHHALALVLQPARVEALRLLVRLTVRDPFSD